MNNTTDSEARLEGILAQVRVLKAKYDERAEVTGENFNVFSILDRESDEVKTHSAIIAELLNPHGSHSQGTLFLELFLKQLKPIIDVRNEHTRFKVRTEVFVFVPENEEKGFLDIVIESNNNDAYIVIENKIDTEDAEGQLKKYCEHIETIEKNKKVLLYLTPEGKNPIYLTHYGKGKVALICLSYKEFIAEWLGACIKEVARIPQIRETLHQYQMTVKKLTGQPINRRYAMALKGILLEDKNYNLIPELDTAISEAKVAFQCDFWTKLKGKLEAQKELKDTRYEVYKGNLKIEERAGPKECIDECASQGGLGLTSSFSEKGNYEIMFRIAHERYPLYYGFVLCEKGGRKKVAIDETKQEHKEYLARYSIADGKADGQSGWLTYKSFNLKINFTDFKFVTEHTEPKREALIERLVGVLVEEEVCGVIKKISEQERDAAT